MVMVFELVPAKGDGDEDGRVGKRWLSRDQLCRGREVTMMREG